MTRAALRLARAPLAMATIVATLLVVATQGLAQSERKGSTALQRRNEPIRIASLSLEVRDRSKMATFSGNVRIRQGEFDLSSDTLVVFYDDEQRNVAGVTEVAATGDRPQIRRMEARGSVVVTQKHQRAASDRADFDMLSNMVTLSGNVVVARCNNMLRGQRLIIDMTTGVSRMEGPVDGLLNSRSGDGGC